MSIECLIVTIQTPAPPPPPIDPWIGKTVCWRNPDKNQDAREHTGVVIQASATTFTIRHSWGVMEVSRTWVSTGACCIPQWAGDLWSGCNPSGKQQAVQNDGCGSIRTTERNCTYIPEDPEHAGQPYKAGDCVFADGKVHKIWYVGKIGWSNFDRVYALEQYPLPNVTASLTFKYTETQPPIVACTW